MGTSVKRPPLVLVIEDDPRVRELVVALLTEQGFQVQQASNGFSGLRLAEQVLPQLILLDLALPEVPGRVVLRELKANGKTRAIPVLLTTAHAELLEAGDQGLAAGLVSKPFDMDTLLGQVRASLPPARSRQVRVPSTSLPLGSPHRSAVRHAASASAPRRARGH
jgi:DNA-binding response OmpR family regulator